jgi:hypothetical protein
MPLQATSGAASYDAFGGGVPAVTNYIEDVFSTYLYTGTNSTQSIVNGIDLSTKGGMCWFKIRDTATYNHALVDTARGRAYTIGSDITDSQYTSSAGNDLASFNTNGFTVGPVQQFSAYNRSGNTIVNWTFRKQPKFFDIVTYTGNDSPGRNIPHNLGSVPGCLFIKRTDTTGDWIVGHRSVGLPRILNSTAASYANTGVIDTPSNTSTTFHVKDDALVNATGGTYVAYLFAHDAGGFGVTGTDNVISCGSFTGSGSAGQEITLGYEPQWLLVKNTTSSSNWLLVDNMRDWTRNTGNNCRMIRANTNAAEEVFSIASPTATGFITSNGGIFASGNTFIYIAIRRGPMKVPTSGTSVFSPVARTGTGAATTITTPNFAVDSVLIKQLNNSADWGLVDKLRGRSQVLSPDNTLTEADFTSSGTTRDVTAFTNLGFNLGTESVFSNNGSGQTYINYAFQRAPGFFDEVCYTGTGSATTFTHNLGVVPELMLVKRRTTVAESWAVYSAATGNTKFLRLNETLAATTSADRWNNTTPTSSVFTTGFDSEVNASGQAYVNYLFATLPGVSKVGSYTGTGTTLQINCGFTAGARFVLIKRTNTTGDWYVWDSARGIVAGNDPYLLLNSTAAEVTNTDYIDTYSAGFELSSTAPAAINASGGTYIFLAIA